MDNGSTTTNGRGRPRWAEQTGWRLSARFAMRGCLWRRPEAELSRAGGREPLLGAVVMINPGSAAADERVPARLGAWAPTTPDLTLRTVGDIVAAGYAAAGQPLPDSGRVLIWNLCDVCEPNLARALTLCAEERLYPWMLPPLPPGLPWVWRAWGLARRVLRPRMRLWEAHLAGLPALGAPAPPSAGGPNGYYHPAYLRRMRRRRPELWDAVVAQLAAQLVAQPRAAETQTDA